MPDRRFTTLLADIARDTPHEWTALVCRESAAYIERLEAALRKADEWFDNMETFDSADEGLSIIKLDAAAYQRMEAVGDALRRALDGEDTDG